jgi:hypothetical protein
MSAARGQIQRAFRANANVNIIDPAILPSLLDRGQYVLSELRALERLHKYRAMNKRYGRQSLT